MVPEFLVIYPERYIKISDIIHSGLPLLKLFAVSKNPLLFDHYFITFVLCQLPFRAVFIARLFYQQHPAHGCRPAIDPQLIKVDTAGQVPGIKSKTMFTRKLILFTDCRHLASVDIPNR